MVRVCHFTETTLSFLLVSLSTAVITTKEEAVTASAGADYPIVHTMTIGGIMKAVQTSGLIVIEI